MVVFELFYLLIYINIIYNAVLYVVIFREIAFTDRKTVIIRVKLASWKR